MTAADTLIKVEALKVHFKLPRPHLLGAHPVVHAVDGVSFSIKRGTTFGLVGESGSGKTTVALAVMRLAAITEGRVQLDDLDLGAIKGNALRHARRRMQIIFQDPYSSLNPRMRASAIVREPMDLMDIGPEGEREGKVADLFRKVGLRPEQLALFPHQFSGGQRQRIGVARALASQPDLVVCDEPVSALDVAIQAQIINLLRDLQRDFNLTYLFISHDLGVVQYFCSEIAVMYLGQIVEQADRMSLFSNPRHPYTWALLSAVPSADPAAKGRGERIRLQGDPPSPIDPPEGCRFAPRCPFAQSRCRAETPALRRFGDDHVAACHLIGDDGSVPHRPHF